MSTKAKNPKPRDPWKVATGHRPHITGSGIHGDKRTKRNRDRSAQRRNAIAGAY